MRISDWSSDVCSSDLHPIAHAGINLLLAHPLVQGLRYTANLRGNRFDSRPQRRILATVFLHHTHGTLTHFRGKLVLLLHSSILSEVGASTKSGAVQGARRRGDKPKRSEERRVGKECGSTCRSRWSPYH